jgi:hypothetical protein
MDHGGPGPYGPHPGMFGPGNHLDFLKISYPCLLQEFTWILLLLLALIFPYYDI